MAIQHPISGQIFEWSKAYTNSYLKGFNNIFLALQLENWTGNRMLKENSSIPKPDIIVCF
jgi:hypothetical protein